VRRKPDEQDWRLLRALALLLALSMALPGPAQSQRADGFNVVVTPDHPFGGASAHRSLLAARQLGATTVAIVPFLWQQRPSSPDIVRGTDMLDDTLRQAIRQAKNLGFSVMVKPHVWVPTSWAGAVEPASEKHWRIWFARYASELDRIARIAAAEGADSLAIDTELAKTSQRPEWRHLIATARRSFSRPLLYVAHNIEEAERVPFWHLLDAIGVSLYPPLGSDDDRAARLAAMRSVADRLDALSSRTGKAVVVGEIGLRSAKGAAAKPWESAEERQASADPLLQADVLADWLAVLDRPAIRSVLIWRWFTDPDAGGSADTDYTVQGKPAERVLKCVWTDACRRP
jgi:hypothetical protein